MEPQETKAIIHKALDLAATGNVDEAMELLDGLPAAMRQRLTDVIERFNEGERA